MSVEILRFGDDAAWLGKRGIDVTSSDIPALAGVSRYRSAFRVYAEKAKLIDRDRTDTNLMQRGRWLEGSVLTALAEREPTWTIRACLPRVYVRDPALRLGATPDAVAVDPARPGIGNVECKVVSAPAYRSGWMATGSPVPPLDYQLQTLTQALLMDTAWSVVVALVIDTFSAELVVCPIERHAGAEQRIRDLARDFWRNLAAGRFPHPDYGRDVETIDAMHPRATVKTVDMRGSNRFGAALAERAIALADKKAAETRLDALDAEIKHAMGDAEEAFVNGWAVTWRLQERKAFEVKAAAFRKLSIRDHRPKEEEIAEND